MDEPRKRNWEASEVPLTKQLIVDTALGIIAELGSEALTMRALAQRLDTGPASLYVYFSNRQSLVDALIDSVLSDVEIPDVDENNDWREQLETLAMRSVELLIKFPGLSGRMVGRVPTSEALLKISEAYLRILINSGHSETWSLLAVDVLNTVVIAEANEISVFEKTVPEGHLEEVEGVLSGLDPEKYPYLSRLSHAAMQPTPTERARWAIHTFIQGLAANENLGQASS